MEHSTKLSELQEKVSLLTKKKNEEAPVRICIPWGNHCRSTLFIKFLAGLNETLRKEKISTVPVTATNIIRNQHGILMSLPRLIERTFGDFILVNDIVGYVHRQGGRRSTQKRPFQKLYVSHPYKDTPLYMQAIELSETISRLGLDAYFIQEIDLEFNFPTGNWIVTGKDLDLKSLNESTGLIWKKFRRKISMIPKTPENRLKGKEKITEHMQAEEKPPPQAESST